MKKFRILLICIMAFIVSVGTAFAANVPNIATAEEVQKALNDNTARVIDARPQNVFSGWAYGENSLGGHIEGATDFSANWLVSKYDDNKNAEKMTRADLLKKYMADKNISKDTALIIYDENGKDALAVAQYFASEGLTNIKTFNLANWPEKLVKYPNYQLYVPAEVLNKILQGEKVEEIAYSDNKPVVVLEVSWGTEEQSEFLKGHIPGAIHVNSDDFDDEDNVYMLESDTVLEALALSQGITAKSTVIVSGDPIFSCRYATILRYLGVDNVYVLSGGANSWANAGYPLVKEETKIVPATEFGVAVPLRPEIINTVAQTQEMLKKDDYVLVDNRTEKEFLGETSGYSYFPTAGRIPGAVYGYAGINTSGSMLYYRNIDDTMRNGEEILNMWKSAGIDTSKHLAFMCGGGYRASEVYWDSLVMGMDNTSLFADGWCGWALAKLPSISGK